MTREQRDELRRKVDAGSYQAAMTTVQAIMDSQPYQLLLKGMESQADLMDNMKQEMRTLRSLLSGFMEATEWVEQPAFEQVKFSDQLAIREMREKVHAHTNQQSVGPTCSGLVQDQTRESTPGEVQESS